MNLFQTIPMIGVNNGVWPSALALSKGVPEYLTINGVSARLLKGQDNQPLKGLDGQYLYGRTA